MNDEMRRELELYFDDELPVERRAVVGRRLAEDLESRRYLDRLARLRGLARLQAAVSPRRPSWVLPRRRIAAAALAVGLTVAIGWCARSKPKGPVFPVASPAVAVVPNSAVPDSVVPISEVELYTWANRDRRTPEAVVDVLLRSGGRTRRLPSSVEVLALDLANATPGQADELEPLAFVHKVPPGGRGHIARRARRPRPPVPRA